MSSAESDIKDIMEAFKTNFNYENEDEIVIIPKNLMKMVDKKYALIGKNYMGHISELITKIKELEHNNETQLLNCQLELSKEREKNEKQLLNHQLELLKKDIEIIKLQNK